MGYKTTPSSLIFHKTKFFICIKYYIQMIKLSVILYDGVTNIIELTIFFIIVQNIFSRSIKSNGFQLCNVC